MFLNLFRKKPQSFFIISFSYSGVSWLQNCLIELGIKPSACSMSVTQDIFIFDKKIDSLINSYKTDNTFNPLFLLYPALHKQQFFFRNDLISIFTHHKIPESKETLAVKGANVNYTDQNGWSALHFAAQNGDLEMINFLLSKGANVNCTNYEYHTPLHLAFKNNRIEVAQFLMDKGGY